MKGSRVEITVKEFLPKGLEWVGEEEPTRGLVVTGFTQSEGMLDPKSRQRLLSEVTSW